jgi:hypothetical protein
MTTPPPGPGSPSSVLAPFDTASLPFPRVVSVKATAASQQLLTGTGLIISLDANETTGGAAFGIYLHDGTDTTGQIIAALAAPASSGENVSPAPPGIPFKDGIYIERVAGTFTLVVVYLPINYPLP